ncbi:MAG: hypothetical protein AAGC93_31690, partial [Cyanobacteria bacterium P01_F01_bin.53]
TLSVGGWNLATILAFRAYRCSIVNSPIVADCSHMADRAKGLLQNPKANKIINRIAGSAMLVTGLYLVAASVAGGANHVTQ